MKIKNRLTIAALVPAAILTFTACSTSLPPWTASQAGVAGGTRIETFSVKATVTAIDKDARKVTLVTSDGLKSVVKCGPEVVNFPQIEVGDKVKAAVTQHLVVSVRKPGEPAGDGAAGAIVLAPLGEKPGGMIANTEEITAKVKSIDFTSRTAKVVYPDGTTQTFKIRSDVNLANYSVGDEVVFNMTEAIAVSVEKP